MQYVVVLQYYIMPLKLLFLLSLSAAPAPCLSVRSPDDGGDLAALMISGLLLSDAEPRGGALDRILSTQETRGDEVLLLLPPPAGQVEQDGLLHLMSVAFSLGSRYLGFDPGNGSSPVTCPEDRRSVIVDLSSAGAGAGGQGGRFTTPHCVWLLPDTPANRGGALDARPAYDSHVVLVRVGGPGVVEGAVEVFSPDPDVLPAVTRPLLGGEEADSIWERRRDLMGKRFTLAYVETEGYIKVEEDGRAAGFTVDILEFLADRLNFTYDLVPSYDGNFGVVDADGNWNGLIRMLLDGEADFSPSLTSVTRERSKVVDYTVTLTFFENELWIRTAQYFDASVLLGMLHRNLWLASAFGLLAAFCLGILLGKVLEGSAEVSLAVVALFLQQGVISNLSGCTVRILSLSVVLFGFFFFNIFSARLAASLAVRTFADRVRSFEDVLRDEDYELYVVGGSSLSQSLASAEEGSARRRLWEERVLRSERFHTRSYDGIGRSYFESDEKAAVMYAYHGLMPKWIRKFAPEAGCQMYRARLAGDANYGAFPFRRNSPYRAAFNHVLLRWRETGVNNLMIWDWYGRFEEDLCEQGSVFKSFDMDSVRAFFLLLPCGALVALVVLTYEQLRSKRDAAHATAAVFRRTRRLDRKVSYVSYY